MVKHKANIASVNKIKEIKERKNEEKTGNINISVNLYGCNEISSVKLKNTYTRCKNAKSMDKGKKYVLGKARGSIERREGARKKNNKEKEGIRYKDLYNGKEYKTCKVRYMKKMVRKATVKSGKNKKPKRKKMQIYTYMKGACTHWYSTDSTRHGRDVRRIVACRKNIKKKEKMNKDLRTGNKNIACNVQYGKITECTDKETSGENKKPKRKKMQTQTNMKGACTHRQSTGRTRNECTVHGRTSQHSVREGAKRQHVCIVMCESKTWCIYMRYSAKKEIKKNVMVIDPNIMAEPMDIPEGGGGDGVKDDGGKGENDKKYSLSKTEYMWGPIPNVIECIYKYDVKYVCNWYSRYGE